MTDFPQQYPQQFSELALPATLAPGLDALGYTQMTPVQAQSLPAILARRDLLVVAPTGSGKTAAFGLGLLAGIDPALRRVQALILCPTRELADQVAKQIRRLATGIANLKLSVLTGGVSLGPQIATLEADDPHVVVGTPGRVQELLRKQVLHLGGLKVLVLDEADRMLDMGFEEALNDIVARTPKSRQTLLFSATFADAPRAVAKSVLRDPTEVHVEATEARGVIEQRFFEVELPNKQKVLAALLQQHKPELAIVFCNTRRDVDEVAESLCHFGFSAAALHGDMEQRDRDEVLVQFANRSCTVLVASDVAARGLDVADLAAVINYEVPPDPDQYVHRIGRTGRAGKSGLALNLVTARESHRCKAIEEAVGQPAQWHKAPPGNARPDVVGAAPMVTLRIDGGKTDKLRPGDILGALTGDAGLPGTAIGKIDIFPTRSYVAIQRALGGKALSALSKGKIKGRSFRVRKL